MEHKTFFKKPKKKSNQQIKRVWINANSKLWSKLIRTRDNYTCQWCGSIKLPQAHHIVARGITQNCKPAWFDIDNGITLCYVCHIHKLKSYPDEYIVFRDKWMLKHCDSTYKDLRLLFSAKTKTGVDHLEIIYNDLLKTCKKRNIKI